MSTLRTAFSTDREQPTIRLAARRVLDRATRILVAVGQTRTAEEAFRDIPGQQSRTIAAAVLDAREPLTLLRGKGTRRDVHDTVGADDTLLSNIVAIDALRGRGACKCGSRNRVATVRRRGQEPKVMCSDCRRRDPGVALWVARGPEGAA